MFVLHKVAIPQTTTENGRAGLLVLWLAELRATPHANYLGGRGAKTTQKKGWVVINLSPAEANLKCVLFYNIRPSLFL